MDRAATGAEPGTERDSARSRERGREIADLYETSMKLYRDGKLARARQGLVQVLESGLIPPAMADTIRGYLSDIDKRLADAAAPDQKR